MSRRKWGTHIIPKDGTRATAEARRAAIDAFVQARRVRRQKAPTPRRVEESEGWELADDLDAADWIGAHHHLNQREARAQAAGR